MKTKDQTENLNEQVNSKASWMYLGRKKFFQLREEHEKGEYFIRMLRDLVASVESYYSQTRRSGSDLLHEASKVHEQAMEWMKQPMERTWDFADLMKRRDILTAMMLSVILMRIDLDMKAIDHYEEIERNSREGVDDG